MVHLYPTLVVRKRNYGHLYPKSRLILSHSLPHLRGEKERPQSAYPKYSLILMVHHYPTLELRKRNPGNLYPKSSLILRVIHCPTLEEKRRDLSLPVLNTASHYPTQEQKKAD